MLAEEDRTKYLQAGRIAAKARDAVLPKIKPGALLLDIAEEIERRIVEAGAKPAFPVNIGINEIAAHFTPQAGDKRVIAPGDVVKIDVGAQVDGYIADMAFTCCSEKSPLVAAAEKALKAGISMMRPGVSISEVSGAIYDAISGAGFGPIVNLTGHSIGRFDFHGQIPIPNIRQPWEYELKAGEVFALEPFVCESAGRVEDSEPVEIYQFVRRRPVRSPESRRILDLAEKDFTGFPFAKRWLAGNMTPLRLGAALLELERVGAIRSYPVLKDMHGRKIAQAEHTVIVAEKPIVTTE